ncbi:phosphatase PAP2 family protein [Nonomuraea sp. SMC257]|uniref:Phosphatase PAP2 family protein n=2 Tax=Nonomuraea montanisoli TaxID=2741721 RepID=A0A7Y6M2V5_9ACTN|nr:phosphatase PAP2 family protein [Nonomuraea montanisoli]
MEARLDRDRGRGLRLTVTCMAGALLVIAFLPLLVVARMPLNDLDAGATATLHRYALTDPVVTDALIVWTNVFGPWSWRIAVAVLAGWLLRRGAPRLALWAVTTMAVGGLLGAGLKILVDRARPILPEPVALASGEAFPSGHALNVTLGAGVFVLALLPRLSGRGRWTAWGVALFLVVSVAYTRVALGVHWVSDVVAGVVLGMAVIAASTAAFETWRRAQGRRPADQPVEGVEPEAVDAVRRA